MVDEIMAMVEEIKPGNTHYLVDYLVILLTRKAKHTACESDAAAAKEVRLKQNRQNCGWHWKEMVLLKTPVWKDEVMQCVQK